MKHIYKHTFLLIVLFCSVFAVQNANAQGWVWAKGETCGSDWGDGFLCQTDVFNNVYVGGVLAEAYGHIDSICFDTFKFYYPPYSSEIIIAKYDSSGNLHNVIASRGGNAFPINITTDNTGKLYLFGSFSTDSIMFGSTLIVNPHYNPSGNNSCYFIIKFDTSGNIIWYKLGDNIASNGSFSIGGITVDRSYNVHITGSFSDSSITIGSTILYNSHDSTDDIFVAKYDSSGSVIWAKSFGGYRNDMASGIAVSSDDYVYITGSFTSPIITFGSIALTYSVVSAPSNSPDLYLAKLDQYGNVIWANNSIGSGTPFAVKVDYTDQIYICGRIYDTSNFTLGSFVFHNTYLFLGGFLACYNPSGSVIWSKDYCPITAPAAASDNAAVCGLAVDPCNNIWMLGQIPTSGSIFIDSSTVLVGASGTAWPTMIVGYNSSGVLMHSLSFYIEADDNSGISCDNYGNIYYCGDDGRTRNFGGHILYWTGGQEQIMAAKYNPNLGCVIVINPIFGDSILCKGDTTTLHDTTAGGTWSSSNTAVATVSSGTGFVTAVAPGVAIITYSVGTGYFTKTVTVNPCITGISTITGSNGPITISPNPATTQLSIQSTNAPINQITITNILGQTVYTQLSIVNCQLLAIDVSNFPSGIYFIKINGTEVRKFVKQ